MARLKPRAPRRVDIAPRIVYIVLSASSNASALRLSSLQRGWLGHVDPAMSSSQVHKRLCVLRPSSSTARPTCTVVRGANSLSNFSQD